MWQESLTKHNLSFNLGNRARSGSAGRIAGFFSKVIGTIDSVASTKQMPFRILLQTPESEVTCTSGSCVDLKSNKQAVGCAVQVSWEIAKAFTQREIDADWKWLEANVLPKIQAMDTGSDMRDYVVAKIESMCRYVVSRRDITWVQYSLHLHMLFQGYCGR